MAQIREKKCRQQEIDLDQFTDEVLRSRYRFNRESIKYMVEILENNLETDEEKTDISCWQCGYYFM